MTRMFIVVGHDNGYTVMGSFTDELRWRRAIDRYKTDRGEK